MFSNLFAKTPQVNLSSPNSAAICIAYGDRDGGDKDGRDGVHSAVKSGGYCAAKTTPPNEIFALRVLQHPLRPATQFPLNRIDHRAPFAQQKRQPWSIDADWAARGPLEGGYLEISCKIEQYKQKRVLWNIKSKIIVS